MFFSAAAIEAIVVGLLRLSESLMLLVAAFAMP